jgi:GNAT superfamily N-acetyltransferase
MPPVEWIIGQHIYVRLNSMKRTQTMPVPSLTIKEGKVTFRRGSNQDIDEMDAPWFAPDIEDEDSEDSSPEIIEGTRRYWKSLLKGGDILVVGQLNKKLVGRVFVNLTVRQSPRSAIKVDHPTGIIERLKVTIEHQGIGRALIKNAEEIIRSNGLSAAEIGVHESNERALNIYLEQGYNELITKHHERSATFEGFMTFRYQRPTSVLFKYLL